MQWFFLHLKESGCHVRHQISSEGQICHFQSDVEAASSSHSVTHTSGVMT